MTGRMTGSTPPHPVLEKYYPSDADRQSFVGALFDGAARHYNRIGTMLDLGSGPWYRRWALRGAVGILGEPGRVVGVDPSRGMLREARKALSSPLVQGRGEALPFRDDLFDMLSMGFALRHVPDLEAAFREYRRVLKPGGRLVLLEVSRPRSPLSRWLIRVHLQHILPLMARISTRSQPAQLLMKYYWDTIDRCVPPETILEVLRRGGFVDVNRGTLFGFLSEYSASKPSP